MTAFEEELLATDELVCVEPGIGQDIGRYRNGTLTDEQRTRFENHLHFCAKCREDLEYMQWALSHARTAHAAERQQDGPALVLTAVFDDSRKSLQDLYDAKPLSEKLIAGSDDSLGELEFPYIVEYAGGQAVAEFKHRVDHLFFFLKKSPGICRLRCRPLDDSAEARVFDLAEGDEVNVGELRDFVSVKSVEGMLNGIRRFQVLVK